MAMTSRNLVPTAPVVALMAATHRTNEPSQPPPLPATVAFMEKHKIDALVAIPFVELALAEVKEAVLTVTDGTLVEKWVTFKQALAAMEEEVMCLNGGIISNTPS